MSDKSILITGCSSGIGLAAARALKAEGWRVLAGARKPEDLAVLADEGLEALHLDYADPASIAAAADQALALTGGRLFALFNNGAYGQPGAVEDLSVDVLRAQFEANFFGWHDLTRRLIPAMRAAGAGRIVQCSSMLGLVAMPYRGAYIASKFALEGLSDTLRLELRGSGIFVSSIAPGPIATRFVETAKDHFHRNIDIEASAHRDIYLRRLARMERGGASLFKLPANAVIRPLRLALTSRRPKPRYYITVPSHLAAAMRRVLPPRTLDALLAGLAKAET